MKPATCTRAERQKLIVARGQVARRNRTKDLWDGTCTTTRDSLPRSRAQWRPLFEMARGKHMTLELTIREAYAAFGRGDVDGYLQPCTEDFSFNIPGQGAIAGSWRGKSGLYDLARKAMEVTGGTFREEVEDVLANDRHAIVLARHRFTRDGQTREYRTAHVYEVRDGKLAVCWEQPQDLFMFDDAWGIVHSSAAKL